MVQDIFVDIVGTDPVQGLAGGLVIAALNLFGASLVLVWRNPSERALDGALGFAAGVMLAASFTSLILPGIEATPGGNPLPVLAGVLLGALALDQADALVPHAHYLLTGERRSDAAVPPRPSPSPRSASPHWYSSSSPSRSTTCQRVCRSASASGRATSATPWR